MSEKLKELLEKINQEGVRQAEDKAKAIESAARSDAQKIIGDAHQKALKIVKDAEAESLKARESGENALRQAARDLILSLKDEIRKIFKKALSHEINSAMSPGEMAGILHELIVKYVDKDGGDSDIRILLNKDDLARVQSALLRKLKDELSKGIEFKPSSGVRSGFSISFDKGKSFFDFTDESLVDALCVYLNPELGKLLK